MNSINLIPSYRQQRKARHARLTGWAVASAGLLLVLLVSYAGCYVASAGRNVPAESKEINLTRDIARSTETAEHLRAELGQVRQSLASIRHVSNQPDWGLLLAVLSEALDEQIALNRVDLAPAADAERGHSGSAPPVGLVAPSSRAPALPARPAPSERGALMLDLGGFGRSQAAVTRFVLKLESTGLFKHVALLHSSSGAFLSGDAVAFNIEGALASQREEAR